MLGPARWQIARSSTTLRWCGGAAFRTVEVRAGWCCGALRGRGMISSSTALSREGLTFQSPSPRPEPAKLNLSLSVLYKTRERDFLSRLW